MVSNTKNVSEWKLHRFQFLLLAYDSLQTVFLYLEDTLVILLSWKVEDSLHVHVFIRKIFSTKATNK